MRAEIALEYLMNRMCEMGYSGMEIYTRHVAVGTQTSRTIVAGSDLWVFF
jgi:hypothetical protein